MEPQDQQETGKVRLEGKTRASFRMELQDEQEVGRPGGPFRMEFQEQKFTEARVVSGAASSARSAWLSGWNYRIRTSIKGLE